MQQLTKQNIQKIIKELSVAYVVAKTIIAFRTEIKSKRQVVFLLTELKPFDRFLAKATKAIIMTMVTAVNIKKPV